MKDYYAFSVDLSNGITTMYLMPTKIGTAFAEGRLEAQSNFLHLFSYADREIFDLIEKFTPEGKFDIDKTTGQPKRERLRVMRPLAYTLEKDQDVRWFVHNFIENSDDFLRVYESFKIKPQIITETEALPTTSQIIQSVE